jgi:signal transduction histidine kinase
MTKGGPGQSGALTLLAVAEARLTADAGCLHEDATSTTEVNRVSAALTNELRDLVTGSPGPEEPLPGSMLARRVLGALRTRILEAAATTPPIASSELLPLLLAVERVHDRLAPGWDQRFADRMSGPDGLELVMEVAHDLRSPLTSILFLAETLLRGRSGPVTALQERQLGLIYSAAFGLSSVASDVVELVRGRDRIADLQPMPFSISDLFESVRDIIRPIAEEKGLEISFRMPTSPFRTGHPVALNRVLLNLTTNALKFTDEGSVELAAVEREGGWVRFSVRDTGRGIPAQAMALLFEPFRRRQRDGEYSFSGSGLGLSICRKFVEAMGARLEVETSTGQGTTFWFELQLPEPVQGSGPVAHHLARL